MLYKSIFLRTKKEIVKRLKSFQDPLQKKEYLEFELKNEILKSEDEIRKAFKKVKCAQCGACCRLAASEFSPDELSKRAEAGDKTAKSFLEVFELYENNKAPETPLLLLPKGQELNGCWFYRCKKVQIREGKYFCPIYDKRPAVCRNFPDTPLENLPKTCAYNVWKDENETKAMFIKAINDIRNFYLNEIKTDKQKG